MTIHDGWLLTFADTIAFLHLVPGTQLAADKKTALEAFLRVPGAQPAQNRAPPFHDTFQHKIYP